MNPKEICRFKTVYPDNPPADINDWYNYIDQLIKTR